MVNIGRKVTGVLWTHVLRTHSVAGYTVMATVMTSGSSQSREKTVIPTGPCAGSTTKNGKHGGRCRDDREN